MAQWPILVVIALPPVLPSVLLLIFFISLWVTLVRPLEKWLHTQGRYSEDERRQYWLAVKANGRERFAWRFGVLRCGLPAFGISTPLILLGYNRHELPRYDIATAMGFVSFIIWAFGGYWFGRYVWQRLSQKYSVSNRDDERANSNFNLLFILRKLLILIDPITVEKSASRKLSRAAG